MKAHTKLNFILLFLFSSLQCFALNDTTSTGAYQLRKPSSESVKKYLEDEDFVYEKTVTEETSLWDHFKLWVLSKILEPFFGNTTIPIWKILEYILIAIFIISALFYIFKMQKTSVFYKNKKAGSFNIELGDEDIHELDFEKVINDAASRRDYKTAIRYLYLKTLKSLSDKKLIGWKNEKTNLDYRRELRPSAYNEGFSEVSNLFEYAWYGEIPITDESFLKIRASFDQFNTHLN